MCLRYQCNLHGEVCHETILPKMDRVRLVIYILVTNRHLATLSHLQMSFSPLQVVVRTTNNTKINSTYHNNKEKR